MGNSQLFFRLLRSPGHLTFVTANVALLVHLQLLSTRRKLEYKENQLQLAKEELEQFYDVVNDLELQNEAIQNQIAELKQRSSKNTKNTIIPKSALNPPNPMDSSNSFSREGLMSPHILSQQLRQKTKVLNQKTLASKYAKEREMFMNLAQSPEIIDGLFSEDVQSSAFVAKSGESNQSSLETGRTSEPLQYTKTYASPLQNSLMLLSSQIFKQFLLELKLRLAFQDRKLLKEYPQESYVTQNSILKRLTREDRLEIQELIADIEQDDLEVKLTDILNNLSQDEAFSCSTLKREDFYHYKSAHWLNYAESDTTNLIRSDVRPRFLSPVINDEEYIGKFSKLFSAYKSDTHPFKHINLALQVAKILANGGNYSPSLQVFRVLLDKFGEVGLFNYQALVYDTLPSFESGEFEPLSQRADADSTTQGLYLKLIEKEPQYLKSLIEYEFQRQHYQNLNYLLNYLEPQAKKPHSLPFMPLFLFSLIGNPSPSTSLESILVEVNAVESALKVCFKMRDYERMDRILMKLLSDLVLTTNGISVHINGVPRLVDKADEAQTILSSEKSVTDSSSNKAAAATERSCHNLLTDSVLNTLGEAYILQRDKRRLAWLSLLISDRLKEKPSNSLLTINKKLQSIEPIVPTSYEDKVPSARMTRKSKRENSVRTKSHGKTQIIEIGTSKKILSSTLLAKSQSFVDRTVSMAA